MYYDIVMLDGYVSDEVDYISKFRDLKIRMINGENLFQIDKDKLKQHKDKLDFISDTLSNDIITGSLSLSLYGLLNRDIGDIDILIKDSDRYDSYRSYGYGEDDISSRLGYKNIKYKPSFFKISKTYEVDFFKDNGVHFEEFNYNGTTLKVHHPIEIISHKIEINRITASSKHSGDLYRIFEYINFEN